MKNCVLVIVFGIMVLLAGCASNKGAVCPQEPWVPISGNLVWVEDAPIKIVYETMLKTAKEMNFSISKQECDDLSGVILAANIAVEKISIKLSPETSTTTRVSIRVGTFADEKKARVIYDKFKKNLPNKNNEKCALK